MTKYSDDKLNKMEKAWDKWFNSPAADEYFAQQKIESDIHNKRLEKVELYLKSHSIKEVIKRLQKEHNDEYQEKCYKKGYEPYPNHKFNLLWDYI